MKKNKTFHTLLLVLTLFVGGLFYLYGARTWEIWNIPTLTPSFIDARILTASAESYRLGFDPNIENPQDPYGRLFNLPSIWKVLFLTGLNQMQTGMLAGILIGCFLIGLIIFPGRLSFFPACLLSFCAVSPPVFLAFERGNVDLVVFLVCALSLIWMERNQIVSVFFLWLAGILKIFPVFGLLSLTHLEKGKFGKYIIYFTLSFGLYALLALKGFLSAFSNTEIGLDFSYGLGVLPYYVEEASGRYEYILLASLFSVLLALGIIFFSFYLWYRTDELLTGNNIRDFSAYRLGAGIYIGTFLLGNNWDYRLIFLLFTLPQLVGWARQSRVAKCTLISIVVSLCYLWLVKFLPFSYFLDEFANWFTFAGLFYLTIVSLPLWMKDNMSKFFETQKRKSV